VESERAFERVGQQLIRLELSAARLRDAREEPGHVRIRAEGLSKQYRRSLTQHLFPIPFTGQGKLAKPGDWALKDVSFSIAEGSMVGLFGDHAAGKSTLLKILGRVIQPTEGRAEIRGRLIPLLSLQSAVSLDGPARANARLLAQLYGIPTSVPDANMDRILKIAGNADPTMKLKHYSSGMTKRLTAAIALGLEPDVVLVDNIFGARGGAFQDEILTRIRAESRRRGLTALIALEDPEALREFCDRTLWLDQGRLVAEGPTATILDRYARIQDKRVTKRVERLRQRRVQRRQQIRSRMAELARRGDSAAAEGTVTNRKRT
jgi:ABC-type polysaccharide/polyol phosphate transport system ATPase subunit